MNLHKNIAKLAIAGSLALAFTACSSSDSPAAPSDPTGSENTNGEVIDPGTTPVDPGTTTPVDPGTTTPVDPGTTTPVDPGTTTPVDPGTTTPSANEGFGLWDGTAGDTQVPTGNDAAGYWYSYNDNNGGDNGDGKSTLTWKVPAGDEFDDGSMAPVIAACNGLCGDFMLDQGEYKYNPYVGFGFNFSATDDDVVDLTASKGICVAYESDYEIVIELGLGASTDLAIGYANPSYTLDPVTAATVVDIPWEDFAQPGWASETVENPEKTLASLKFKFTGSDGDAGKFNLSKVGPMGSCK